MSRRQQLIRVAVDELAVVNAQQQRLLETQARLCERLWTHLMRLWANALLGLIVADTTIDESTYVERVTTIGFDLLSAVVQEMDGVRMRIAEFGNQVANFHNECDDLPFEGPRLVPEKSVIANLLHAGNTFIAWHLREEALHRAIAVAAPPNPDVLDAGFLRVLGDSIAVCRRRAARNRRRQALRRGQRARSRTE